MGYIVLDRQLTLQSLLGYHPSRDSATNTGMQRSMRQWFILILLSWLSQTDYAARGIVCNAVAPGKILTGRTDAIDEASLAYARSRTPMAREPLGRLGKADDVAGAALFLACDEFR